MSSVELSPIISSLQSSSNSLASRFRALFTLKGLASLQPTSISQIISSIGSTFTSDSALLKHELAYVLGQIKHPLAEPILISVLSDLSQDEMVRHEAAEALGAISLTSSIPILEKFLNDESVSVRETCELAIEKIKFDNDDGQGESSTSQVRSGTGPIDPAPSLQPLKDLPTSDEIIELKDKLLDDESPLFLRYRAMFSLRDVVLKAREEESGQGKSEGLREDARSKGREATLALARGLGEGVKGGALFRHEICFVFGEISHKSSIPSLLKTLRSSTEHEMVRHEAAEALGGIIEEEIEEGNLNPNLKDTSTEVTIGDGEKALNQLEREEKQLIKNAIETLRDFSKDMELPRVVRESCVVALDEMAYNNDPTQFHRLETENEEAKETQFMKKPSSEVDLPEIKDQVGGGSESTAKEDRDLNKLQDLAGAHA